MRRGKSKIIGLHIDTLSNLKPLNFNQSHIYLWGHLSQQGLKKNSKVAGQKREFAVSPYLHNLLRVALASLGSRELTHLLLS